MARATSPVYQHPGKRLRVIFSEEPEDSVEPDQDVDHVMSLRAGELPGVAEQRDVAASQRTEGDLGRAGYRQ